MNYFAVNAAVVFRDVMFLRTQIHHVHTCKPPSTITVLLVTEQLHWGSWGLSALVKEAAQWW